MSKFINIEVICSDKHEHKRRIKTRKSKIPGLKLPTWKQGENREYHPWHCYRIKIDTALKSIHSCVKELLENIFTEKTSNKI